MREVVIVGGVRTPVGAFGGTLKDVSAIDLGALVIKEAFKRTGLRPVVSDEMKNNAPDKLKDKGVIELEKKVQDWDSSLKPVAIDDVIIGNVLQAGQGQNPGRQAMIKGGIPKETPAFTINKVCSSGLKAIALGATSIMAGESDVIVAGGMESMSNVPFALLQARWGYRMALTGIGELHDLMVFDGLFEIFYGYHMGITAENIVDLYGITRQEQDELSLLSHTRALKAIKDGTFAKEIVPVVIKGRKGDTIVDTDERPMETSMEKLGKMKPAFKKDGSVTAGNASGINDGAAAVIMMSADKAKELGLKPYVKVKGFAAGGLDPAYMGLGPIPAIRKLLKANKLSVQDIDMWELNEAFASQTIGCLKELGIPTEKPNQLGSGISIGHPIGCTGARQMVTGMNLMQRNGYKHGIISMCIGGGMGFAMLVENAG
ncbi:MAG: acetyl-CoA C-acetyltransferase [Nitrospirae bacterium]|nr:acetyl-CoA C-acetyltransferase [Nitrospirota bacterium]MBF0535520.1 acetyl-CoA C-acetyltransferase [Nitrospirota bacterium]MBF0617453.1 acetyl-CoA C-acetyltransferase [Nitrospirota bacterium]